MPIERKLARVITLPEPSPGQFGPAHRAVEVITPGQWADNDPFILLMDDRLDGELIGGPHPHAGFETVSFLVDGEMASESGHGRLAPGDVEWTTAGKGIVHGSTGIRGRMRLLQLWVTLPKKDRWTDPDHQLVPAASALVRREPGAEIRLYSGASGPLQSPTRNRVPMTLVDVHLDGGASIEQALPTSHNGFFYVLEGTAQLGADATSLVPGQIGWLDRPQIAGESTIRIASAGAGKLRVLLYSGERQNVPIVSYGPFIGDTRQDIVRSIERYQSGVFQHY
jgi:redox-sensitive bicupin YhaK (pirin superfamily)